MRALNCYLAVTTLFLVIVANDSRSIRKREHRRLSQRFSNPLLVRYNVQRKINDVPKNIEHILNKNRNDIMKNVDNINSLVNKGLDIGEKIYAEVKLNYENPDIRVQAYFSEDLNGQVKVPAAEMTTRRTEVAEKEANDIFDVSPNVLDTDKPMPPDVDENVFSTKSATPLVEVTDDDELATSSGDGDIFTSTEEYSLLQKEPTHFFETEIITPKRIYNLLQ